MEYKKIILNDYILGVALVKTGGNITEAEFTKISDIIRNRPTATDGFAYRLTENLEWEPYELPTEEVTNKEATVEDYEAALVEMGSRYDESRIEHRS